MKLLVPGIAVLLILTMAFSGCMDQKPAAPAPVPSQESVSPVITKTLSLPEPLAGRWILTTFGTGGGTVVSRPSSEISLSMNPDGNLTGFGGCNNYFGTFVMTGAETPKGYGMIVFDLGSTKKYCQSESGDEQQYLAILERAASCSGEKDFLTLTAENGDSLGFRRPGAASVGVIGQI